MTLPGSGHTLYAAGGSDANIHISMHASYSSTELYWSIADEVIGSFTNNSLILASHILGSEEPRLVVSNNDHSITFIDIPVRARPETLTDLICGTLELDYPVNHCK